MNSETLLYCTLSFIATLRWYEKHLLEYPNVRDLASDTVMPRYPRFPSTLRHPEGTRARVGCEFA